MQIIYNILAIILLALASFFIVWLLFKLIKKFFGKDSPKWLITALITAFIIVFVGLLNLYIPLINPPTNIVEIKETSYGSLEVDVNKIFEPKNNSEYLQYLKNRNYFFSEDTSFYLEVPNNSFWQSNRFDSTCFNSVLSLISKKYSMFYDIKKSLLKLPQIENDKFIKYCLKENEKFNIEFNIESKINGFPIYKNILENPQFWETVIQVLVENKDKLGIPKDITKEEILNSKDEAIKYFIEKLAHTMVLSDTSYKSNYIFNNSLSIASINLEELQIELYDKIGIEKSDLHLMRFASNMEDIIPHFSLASLQNISVSKESDILFARRPIKLKNVQMNGTNLEQITIENLYLIGISNRKGYFVQIKFLIKPGDDLKAWRDIQNILRTIRFIK